MFGLSGEHLIILTIAFLFFGPKYLPSAGKSAGKLARLFKGEQNAGKPGPDVVVDAEFRRVKPSTSSTKE